jgi:hypothetical protein
MCTNLAQGTMTEMGSHYFRRDDVDPVPLAGPVIPPVGMSLTSRDRGYHARARGSGRDASRLDGAIVLIK